MIWSKDKEELHREALKAKQTKQKRLDLLEQIKSDAAKRGIVPKCLADHVQLYYRYLIRKSIHDRQVQDNLGIRRFFENRLELEIDMTASVYERKLMKKADELYYQIRGNPDFIDRHTLAPSVLAVGIVYIVYYLEFGWSGLTQKQVADFMGMTPGTVRRSYIFLKEKLRL